MPGRFGGDGRGDMSRSRLIFRNLPPDITPASFQAKLTDPPQLQDVTVTDLKLVPHRRFAFVGFKSPEEAERVRAWLDGSYALGGGKVKVELVGDRPLAGKNRKATNVTTVQRGNEGNTDENGAGPSRLREFMDVMKGTDSSMPSGATKPDRKLKKKRKGDSPEPAKEADEDDDAAWLRRRQLDGVGRTDTSAEEPSDPDSQLILSTARLFLRNLPFITTSEDLSQLFEPFGETTEIHLPISGDKPLGTAFIRFREPQAALLAFQRLDGSTFQGRLLHILPGRVKPGEEERITGDVMESDVLGKRRDTHSDVKGRVESRRHDTSSKGVSWATLYMNSDAVAASVATRLGVDKASLLTGSDNPAVQLALAETTVINDIRHFFETEGINLESLSARAPRSSTTILVKNIPFGTSTQSLTDLFGTHGPLKRVLLPPAGTLGVVEFETSSDSAIAFKALSYRRLGNAVLYLEKGPSGMFSKPQGEHQGQETKLDPALEVAKRVAEATDAATTDEPNSTLYLKNLSFATTTPQLQALLSSIIGYSFARVATKNDPVRGTLSMGYGFVGFQTREAAKKALSGLTGFEIDGKVLDVKFAQRDTEASASKADAGLGKGFAKSTKVLVKNIPFEATKKDLRGLFSAHASLKSLRLPMKPHPTSSGSKSTRGFAFLEFATHSDAQRAMDALRHTHLLGRHLVMEWANEGDEIDIEGLREKVKGDVFAVGPTKRRKVDLGGGHEVDDEERV